MKGGRGGSDGGWLVGWMAYCIGTGREEGGKERGEGEDGLMLPKSQ